MELITITFTKWEDWNPRTDYKHPYWFAMSNRITEDDQVQTLSDREFRAFIHLFCLASQQNTATVTANLEKAERVTGIKRSVFRECLRKLVTFGICLIPDGLPSEIRQNPTLQDKTITRQNKTRQDTPPAAFDFERLYKAFPRHEGKESGMKQLAEQVRDQETYADFERAVFHYAALVKRRGTEPKFIKLWSSFVGTKRTTFPWREYIERPKELDQPSASGNESPEERKARMLREHEEYQRRQKEIYGEAQ